VHAPEEAPSLPIEVLHGGYAEVYDDERPDQERPILRSEVDEV
jgi:hypothetical protein